MQQVDNKYCISNIFAQKMYITKCLYMLLSLILKKVKVLKVVRVVRVNDSKRRQNFHIAYSTSKQRT